MKDLFVNTQLPVVTSDRILYTPSNFARTSLLYLQEIGSLQVHKPHSTGRSNLSSYLFFTVTDGEGELICEGRTYSLRTGDCVFIDCRKQYAHSSSEKLWSLSWIHFYGPNMTAIYDKYKEQSSYIKPFVDKFEQQIMFAEKSWGSFKVVDVETTSLTIKVTLNPGHSMNYHSHKNRDEVWVVISGEGKTIVDGMEQMVKPGDVITMSAGCRHTVIADTELKLIEVQLGADINVHDKQKFELEQ